MHGCCTSNTLQEIITHEVFLDAQNIYGETALFLACSYRQQDSVKILLEAGSNPNAADADGEACLHAAVRGGCSKKIIHKIIDHGANVNATNRRNHTALLLACFSKNEGAINVLLNASANSNIADDVYGETCLHAAVAGYCSIKVLQAMIDHGANVNLANKRNETALTKACFYKNDDAINVLLNASANPNIADEAYGDTCLHDAVAANCSIKVLQAMIDHGANVNATNKKNETALTKACFNQNVGAINVLLNAHANPNIADEADDDTCLHYAVKEDCSIEVLQAIIEHGVDLNATNKENRTALMIACCRKNEGAINVLLNARADPNIADEAYGDTCLHVAVSEDCSKEVIKAIIAHGVDLNATNNKNHTALMIACIRKNEGAINVLLNARADPNIADEAYGEACLHKAVICNCSIEVLQEIIDHGANVNLANKRNETALTAACFCKNDDAVNVLLNASANPNIADEAYGETCLHKAVTWNCIIEVLQEIIDRGANVNLANKRNETALTAACFYVNGDAINVLLNASANPNIADEAYGDTCLHDAVAANCSIKVIDHGANVNATNKKNETALTIACFNQNVGAINVLLNALADPNIADEADDDTCLHYAVKEDCSIEVLQAIIEHGVDLNATNKENRTALMIACCRKNEGAINVLLNARADPNIADEAYGDTCLHVAVSEDCSKEVIKAIIAHGVDLNATNNKNHTALMIACIRKNEGAINVLLNARADPNIADEAYGEACLHKAVICNCSIEVLQEIIDHGANVNATNKRNETALIKACYNTNEGAINVLLNANANPNITIDTDCGACLNEAVRGDCGKKVPQAMISNGAHVNVTKKSNLTPLMEACQNGNLAVINVLLNAAADIKISDNFGRTCLHFVFYSGEHSSQADIDHCTVVREAKKTKHAVLVLRMSTLYAVSVLLKSQMDPHNPVYKYISEQLLQDITNLGADLLVVKDGHESAAAQWLSCNSRQRESMNALLRAGADITNADVFGDTCLHKVLHREYLSLEYDHVTLQMLLDHGAPVNATNKNEQTAYMLACDQGNIDAMCALLKAGAGPKIICKDNDASLQHTDDGCSSNVTLQAVKQWLDPAWHYLDLPALEITESLNFNLVSRIISDMMRHVICSKR